MKLTGKITAVAMGLNGKPLVTIEVNEKTALFDGVDELQKEDLDIELKKFRKKRSLDANAYAWTLIGKIAEVAGRTKEEVYREEIRSIGGNYDILCCRTETAAKLRGAWSERGIGWITDTMPSKIDGCVNVVLYYGSSTYDTKQMHHFIECVIQDAKALGIQTETPAEIERMVSLWKA